MGADVVKVEAPGAGDAMRSVYGPPPAQDSAPFPVRDQRRRRARTP